MTVSTSVPESPRHLQRPLWLFDCTLIEADGVLDRAGQLAADHPHLRLGEIIEGLRESIRAVRQSPEYVAALEQCRGEGDYIDHIEAENQRLRALLRSGLR